MKKHGFVFGLLGVCLILCNGCGKKKAPETSDTTSETEEIVEGLTPEQAAKVVARVGDVDITVGEVTEQINNLSPYIRRRWSAPEKRREFLQKLIQIELLSQEAIALGYGDAPSVKRAEEQVMIRLMIKNDLEKELLPNSVDETMLKAEYERQIDTYQKPKRIRVSEIVTDTEAEGQALISQLMKADNRLATFRTLAEEKSINRVSGSRGGDLGYLYAPDGPHAKTDTDSSTDASKVDPKVVEAAWTLTQQYDVAPHPIKTDTGYHVIMLTVIRPPLNRPFDSVKKLLENQLLRKMRRQKMDEFVTSLRQKANIKIDKDALEQVNIDVSQDDMAPYIPRIPTDVTPDKHNASAEATDSRDSQDD